MGELEDAIQAAKESALAVAAAAPLCGYSMASEINALCIEAVDSFRTRSRTPLPFYLANQREVFLPGDRPQARRIETIRTYQRLPAEGWPIRVFDPGEENTNWICGVLCTDGRLMTDYGYVGTLPDLQPRERVSRPRGFWGPTHRLIDRVVVDELPPAGSASEIVTVGKWPAVRCTFHGYDHPRGRYGPFFPADQFRKAVISTIGW